MTRLTQSDPGRQHSTLDSEIREAIDYLLIAAGLGLLLAYAGARLHRAVMYQAGLRNFAVAAAEAKSESQDRRPEDEPKQTTGFADWSAARIRAYTNALARRTDAPVAVLSIPRLGIDIPVFEGTGELNLNRGAGRIPGTARPGEPGNIGIASHRDGFFRFLKDVRSGDRIALTLRKSDLTYVVDNIEVVTPGDTQVLRPRAKPSVTLVTCYPFYFVGDAPQRYIVQASLAGPGHAPVAAESSANQK